MLDRQVLIVFFFFILLNGLDVITTLLGMRLGIEEGNVTTSSLMERFGVIGALLFKFFIVLALGFASLAALRYAKSPVTRKVVLGGLVFGCFAYGVIVGNNLKALYSQVFC